MDGSHARGWQFYHARPPGVTGDSEGGGRGGHLVIRLDGGVTYPSPNDWPQLPPAEPGETLAAFWDRAIVGDPFLQSIIARTFRNLQGLSLVARPAEQTFGRWEERWPDKVFYRSYDESPRNYHRDRVYWRLVVELCERLRAGDLVMKGHLRDVFALEVVKQGLFRDPFMVLRPRASPGGWFRPEQWHSSQPPQSLSSSYHGLTLWPAEAAAPEREASRAAHDTPPRQVTEAIAPAEEDAKPPVADRQHDSAPPKPSRARPAAEDDQIHACIDALHLALGEEEPPLNRETLYAKAPQWLADTYGVWAVQKALRRCFMDKRHKGKRRTQGQH
jgi:hypothetical protein